MTPATQLKPTTKTPPRTPILFIGVDPGMTGGIAALCGASVSCTTMPHTEQGVWDHFTMTIADPWRTVAGIEQVQGYFSGQDIPASRAFEFGEGYGGLRMALVGHGLKLTKGDPALGTAYCTPTQEWQCGLGIDARRKSESDGEWKRRLLWNAQEAFPKRQYPNLPITLRTADALLIALYVKRKYSGE
jgi:hypothetical protein